MPFLEDPGGVGRQASRHLAADVGHVAEHRGPSDQPAVAIVNRHQHQPVGRVADRAVALVGVGGQKDVALFDRAVVAVEEAADERAELADHHAALAIGDHRELVVLLADARGHRGAEQHGVHLVARVAQRAFDDVERDRVDVERPKRLAVALDDCVLPYSASPSMLNADERNRLSRRAILLLRANQDVAESVDLAEMTGQDQRGAVHLRDYRRPLDHVVREQLRAIVEFRAERAPVRPDRSFVPQRGVRARARRRPGGRVLTRGCAPARSRAGSRTRVRRRARR